MLQMIEDLRIEAESPPGPQRAGHAAVITLQFFNVGTQPRTLFFIQSETFRFGQSTFRFKSGSGPTQVQPTGRDGYVAREEDFHPLEPKGRLVFTQRLLLPRSISSGTLTVEWEYQNAIITWPSKMSNSGDPIPGILKGRLAVDFKVKVTR
jgi:hypothetical protein